MAFLLCLLLLTVPGSGGVLADRGPMDRPEVLSPTGAVPADGDPADGAGRGREANYSDEFDGAALDPKWSWYNPPASYDMGVTRPGALHMVANRATNFAATADNGALLYQMLNGSFSLETEVFSSPANDYEKSGLMARQNASNWVALKYQWENGAKVELSVKSGGVVNDRLLTPLSASPVYLKLQRDGSTFTTYYSTNGINWTWQWSSALVMNDTLDVGLLIADGNANTDFAADFEYFRFRLPNRSPFISQGFTPVSVEEDSRLGLKAYDHFSDPDGDQLAYTVAAAHIKGWPNNATGDLDIGGTPNWFGVETALVTATDPSGISVTTPVNVTVTPVQDPPFLSKGIPNVTMAQNGTDLSLNL